MLNSLSEEFEPRISRICTISSLHELNLCALCDFCGELRNAPLKQLRLGCAGSEPQLQKRSASRLHKYNWEQAEQSLQLPYYPAATVSQPCRAKPDTQAQIKQ